MTTKTLYAVQDVYGGITLLLVAAESPLGALDAYCDRQQVARYSETLELGDEYADGLVYELERDGRVLTGAVYTNHELVAVPVEGPLELSVGQAGWGVSDAAGIWLTDACDTAEEARAVVLEAAGELGLELRERHSAIAGADVEHELEAAEQERAYELASADVVLALELADAHLIADGLELLLDLVEEEAVDEAGLRRVAELVRRRIAEVQRNPNG